MIMERAEYEYNPSPLQQAVWNSLKRDDYQELKITVSANPDIERLKRSIDKVVARHEILRTTYQQREDNTISCIVNPVNTKDIVPFYVSMSASPDGDISLVCSVHVIAGDSGTLQLLATEIAAAYFERALSETDMPYSRYAAWHNALHSAPEQEAEEYWAQHQVLNNLLTCEFKSSQSGAERVQLTISTEDYRHLTKLAANKEYWLLAIFNMLLQRYTNDDIAALTIAYDQRNYAPLQHTAGLLTTQLPFQAPLIGTDSFIAYVESLSPLIEEARAWGDYYPAGSSELPAFEYLHINRSIDTGFYLTDLKLSAGDSKLKLCCLDDGETLSVDFLYATDSFSADQIHWMQQQFLTLLKESLSHTAEQISSYKIAGEQECQHIMNMQIPYGAHSTQNNIVSLFEYYALHHGDATAVVYDGIRINYRELNASANQLAHYLRNEYQVKRDEEIGLMAGRSERLIIALLGILKSGAAYLPIDIMQPVARKQLILADAGVRILLTDMAFMFEAGPDYSGELFALDIQLSQLTTPDTNPESINEAGDLAYVIYTSGSTGQPKGVCVPHTSLLNYVHWFVKEHHIGPGDSTVLLSSVAFDLCYTSLWTSLSSGSCLYLTEEGPYFDSSALQHLLQDERITYIKMTPSHFRLLLSNGIGNYNLRLIVLGGESIITSDVSLYLSKYPEAVILNHYGPTETTIGVLTHQITIQNLEAFISRPVLGRPISNAHVYILDDTKNLSGISVKGELCISGHVLSRGYLGNPELTAKTFITHPYEPGELLYLSGDMAIQESDGTIRFLGRRDHQLKVRGYRVETGETEHAVEQHPLIRRSAVIVHNSELVCYYESDEAIDMQAHLSLLLPAYMIPSRFIWMPRLPLSGNGKLARNLLPDPDTTEIFNSRYEAATNALEAKLVSIWEEVLGRNKIGIKDNFFDIGGHSLKAVQIVSRVYEELNVKIELRHVFDAPDISQLAAVILAAGNTAYETIQQVPYEPHYALSHAQKRIWILQQMDEEHVAYNRLAGYVFEGAFDKDVFQKAFYALFSRHESLRTTFITVAGTPRQRIHAVTDFDTTITYLDLSDTDDKDQLAQQIADAESLLPFNLERGPLLRLKLLRMDSSKYLFLFNIHHIISDGWTINILIDEILILYHAFLAGKEDPLEPLRIQYKDYVYWHSGLIAGTSFDKNRVFWHSLFEGTIPVLQLPLDFPRPALKTYNGRITGTLIEKELLMQLHQLTRTHGCSLFMTLIGLLNTLLYRYSGQDDIVIGSPVAGRDHRDLEGQIGVFVNTLAIRNRFSGTDSFSDLLHKVRKTILAIYEHQAYPYDLLVEDLHTQIDRDRSRTPLFDVNLVLVSNDVINEDIVDVPDGMQDVLVSKYDTSFTVSKYDLLFHCKEDPEGLYINLEYNTDLFREATAQRMLLHFRNIIKEILADSTTALDDLQYIAGQEKEDLLYHFNNTAVPAFLGHTINDLFKEQVIKSGDKTAIVYEEQQLSFAELDEQVNKLANVLKGVGKGAVIAIMMENSTALIISMLAVLKAGCTFLPVDPATPQERIVYMLNDSGAAMLITQVAVPLAIRQFVYADLNGYSSHAPAITVLPEDLAYIIYTSGSTGTPKGVAIRHESIANYLLWARSAYFSGEHAGVMPLFTSPAYDLTLTSILCPLVNGQKLFIYNSGTVNELLFNAFANLEIDTVKLTPSHISLLNYLQLPYTNVQQVIVGGEILKRSQMDILYGYNRDMLVFNEYGPTEATVGCTMAQATIAYTGIGKPIANTEIYILDHRQQLLPVGVPGEICIAGSCLAAGYIGSPDLTGSKFLSWNGKKIYRTGDSGKWSSDGNLQLEGRIDDQVKIRGHRVEPAEIEKRILQYGIGGDCAVVAKEDADGTLQLTAYVSKDNNCDIVSLQQYLHLHLPDHMVPTSFVLIDALPLSSSGKTDRKKLMLIEADTVKRKSIPPVRTEEIKLAELWKEVLLKDDIGINSNFFDLGGHSLKAMQLITRIYKEMNAIISLGDIFSYPSLEAQAAFIKSAATAVYENIPVIEEQPYYEVSHAQKRLWLLDQVSGAGASYNMYGANVLNGELNMPALLKAFQTLIARHEILRTTFLMQDETLLQQVHAISDDAFSIQQTDLRNNSNREAIAKDMARTAAMLPFDLGKGPLLRVQLLQMDTDRYIFLFAMHHIISDGWSVDVLIKEVMTAYNAFVNNQTPELPELRIQYKDYAAWQNSKLEEPESNIHQQFWMEHFSGNVPVLKLPMDYPRPAIKTYNGATAAFIIDGPLTVMLEDQMKQQGATLFMGLMTTLYTLLYHYTGQDDIVIGIPIAGRDHIDLENQIGLYANTLAIRTRFSASDDFGTLLSTVKEKMTGAYSHAIFPFDRLVELLTSSSPLFDVMAVFQNSGVEMNNVEDASILSIESYDNNYSGSKFDLSFYFIQMGAGMLLRVRYNTDLFTQQRITLMGQEFIHLLKAAIAAPDTAVSKLPLSDQSLLVKDLDIEFSF